MCICISTSPPMQCGLVAFTVATIAGDPDPMLAPILGAPQPGCEKASAGEVVFQPPGVEPHDHVVYIFNGIFGLF